MPRKVTHVYAVVDRHGEINPNTLNTLPYWSWWKFEHSLTEEDIDPKHMSKKFKELREQGYRVERFKLVHDPEKEIVKRENRDA